MDYNRHAVRIDCVASCATMLGACWNVPIERADGDSAVSLRLAVQLATLEGRASDKISRQAQLGNQGESG